MNQLFTSKLTYCLINGNPHCVTKGQFNKFSNVHKTEVITKQEYINKLKK